MISAGRNSLELMVKPAARAASTLMRKRMRLFSVVNWIITPASAALGNIGNCQDAAMVQRREDLPQLPGLGRGR